MGADNFISYFGIGWVVSDPHEIELLELRKDPRLLKAREHKLNHWWGTTIEEGSYYLLIGTELAKLGYEADSYRTINESVVQEIIQKTKDKLGKAGFSDEPTFHFHFAPDY